jgi:uncharacterized protein
MLHLSLAAVDRGEVTLREQIPPEHPMWSDTGVTLTRPLEVDLTARYVGDDDVLVRGTLRTAFSLACRRCLAPVEVVVDEHVDLLFAVPMEGEELGDDGEVYPLPRGDDLDLTSAVREHVVLESPAFALCGEDCRGLCPTCGADLNQGACECVPETADSPWNALKNVKFD